MIKNKPTKKQLQEMYVVQKMSSIKIAKVIDCCSATIIKLLKEYGIPMRTWEESLQGHIKTLEHRKKLSESKKGPKHPNFGKKCKIHGKRCWYTLPDGRVVSMRSQWEVWYAEYLKENNISFKYEEFTFNLADGRAYTPDFLLIDANVYVEVKGFFRPEHIAKFVQFKIEHPNVDVILADKKYLENKGIDLRKKWIASKPFFPCEYCHNEYHRQYPKQRFCSVSCRNSAIAQGYCIKNEETKPKRKYNGQQAGQMNNSAKIKIEQVLEIRRLHDLGLNHSEISRQMNNISPGNISNIVNRKSWTHI